MPFLTCEMLSAVCSKTFSESKFRLYLLDILKFTVCLSDSIALKKAESRQFSETSLAFLNKGSGASDWEDPGNN